MPTQQYQSLSPAQKATLIEKCNTYKDLERIAYHISTSELSFEEMPDLFPQRRAAIEEILRRPRPADPLEQQQWASLSPRIAKIDSMPEQGLINLRIALQDYIRTWQPEKPMGHHLDQASACVTQIGRVLEANIWETVNKYDLESLLGYITQHPDSSYMLDANKYVWDLVEPNISNTYYLNKYINALQPIVESIMDISAKESVRNHLNTAQSALRDFTDWQIARDTNDIEVIWNYMQYHPNTPFFNEIRATIDRLKPALFEEFRDNLNSDLYIAKYDALTTSGIVSEEEFKAAGIVTDESIQVMRTSARPPLSMDRSQNSSPEGHTDVFLFGIPATGKTCLIMGLLNSNSFQWDSSSFSGEYGQQLQNYCELRRTPPSTPGNFVAVINGFIRDKHNRKVKHPVNIVDMAGETFANKIAYNPDSEVSFEDMGDGATEILKNKNPKVFFIIVDPTSDTVRNLSMGVSQKRTLQKMVNLFQREENKEIMSKVKAIHFVMTKSDMFDGGQSRNDEARNEAALRCIHGYQQTLDALRDLCEEFPEINQLSGNLPKLFTFSLGKFYLGGVYDYDSQDADKIINLVSLSTTGRRQETVVDKFQKALNTKIF